MIPGPQDRSGRIANFYDLYPNHAGSYDVRVNTAARLSASFPYVAPAARPNLDTPYGEGFHFVDGGYYDNFGMNSLLAWLEEAFEDGEVASRLTDVLILEIRHFNPEKVPGGTRPGWLFQLEAPLSALFKMRDFAQDSVARNQLAYFGKYFGEKKARVWQTTVDYTGEGACSDAPLSWKLDREQQECIVNTWDRVRKEQQKALRCVDEFVGGKEQLTDCMRAADADKK